MVKSIFRIKIVESRTEIERKIKTAIKYRLITANVLKKAADWSSVRIKLLFRKTMEESPVYQSLTTGGTLVGEFGLEDPAGKINAIMHKWEDSMKTTLQMVRGGGSLGIKGGFRIEMVKANYAEVLRMAEAKQRATSKRPKKDQRLLKWLDWLLNRGNEVIVLGYESYWRPNISGSRTGMAVMFKSKTGRSWSVPKMFVGPDNFVLEVLKKMQPEVRKIIEEELKRAAVGI